MTSSLHRTGQRLGLLLLGYFSMLVAAIVLAPFRFVRPDALHLAIIVGSDWWLDAILNVVLFIPLGFVGSRAGRGSGGGMTVVLLAALFSAALELTQLAIPGRYGTLSDVIANTLGAWLGVRAAAGIERRLGRDGGMVRGLLLDVPLTGLVWLLLPVLWLDGLAGLGDPSRLRLALPLALAGGLAIAAIEMTGRAIAPRIADHAVAMTAGWYAIGALPMVAIAPHLAGLGLAVALLGAVAGDAAWHRAALRERRLEPRVLRYVVPLLLLYLGGLALSPGSLDTVRGDAARLAMLRWIEHVAGFTLLGYAVAQWGGRREAPVAATALPGAILAVAFGMVLAIVRPAPGGWSAAAVMGAAAGFGGVLYAFQRAHVIALRTR